MLCLPLTPSCVLQPLAFDKVQGPLIKYKGQLVDIDAVVFLISIVHANQRNAMLPRAKTKTHI